MNEKIYGLIRHILSFGAGVLVTKGVIDEKVVDIFKKWGFSWGGEIFNKFWDSHHFEVIM